MTTSSTTTPHTSMFMNMVGKSKIMMTRVETLIFQTVPSSGSAVPLVHVSSDAQSVTVSMLVLMVTFTLTAGAPDTG